MAFALTVNQLIPALKQPGCPICNLQRASAQRFLEAFLQENLMDRAARQKALDSLGFCPSHTFDLVVLEMRKDGDPLGTVILHEHINIQVQRALRDWQREYTEGPSGALAQIRRKLVGKKSQPLQPNGECPVCIGMRENNARGLAALVDEIGRGDDELIDLYKNGDGLCLPHLRHGLSAFGETYPVGADFLVADASARLESQRRGMQEYIRKHNLSYQDEKITPEEERAWRQALTFHSGYSPGSFGPFERKPE